MPIETAVILAAGQGIRLGPLGRVTPKGFLQLDLRGRPIIVESIERLRSRGIRRIVVITGHLAAFYEALSERTQDVITVHNPRFAESGSLHSLTCAEGVVAGDFLLLESDLVYEARALDAALDSPRDDVIVVSPPTGSGDEVYVAADGEMIAMISKDRQLSDASVGELVGISKISRRLFERMQRQAESNPIAEYETGALAALAREYALYYCLVPDLVWAEIDTPADFERVRGTVYPRLRGLERASPRSQL